MSGLVDVSTPLLAASGATEAAGTAVMAGADAAAAATTCAVMPPSLDAAGVALAAALNARGAAMQALMAELTGNRGLFASAITVSGISYEATDLVSETLLSR